MDRYRSRASDGHPARPLLEEFAGVVSRALGGSRSPGVLIDPLRQPKGTLSVVEGLRGLAEVEKAGNDCSEEVLLRAAVPDLRDVPDLAKAGISRLKERMAAERRDETPAACSARLSAEIDRRVQRLREQRHARAAFLEEARSQLDEESFRHLRLWADYLEMKAETNETHCLYRGTCFVWFGRVGFRPADEASPRR